MSSDRVDVIDYKTNRVAPEGVPALVASYRPQLAAYRDALAAAGQSDHIFVAGAGNGLFGIIPLDNDQNPFYPASYDLANIISVAATDHNDQLAYFSNYGAESVDLAAPGVDILSTTLNGSYEQLSGTSMATLIGLAVARNHKANRDVRSDGLGEERLTAFIPSTPTPFTGFVILVRPEDVIPLDLPVEDVVKLLVSAGIVAPRVLSEEVGEER